MTKPIQTLDQKRAADALSKINTLVKEDDYGKYGSYVNRMPAMVVMSGLGQACAMLLAQAKGKEKDAHRVLYNHLEQWLCRNDALAPYRNQKTLMQAIVDGSQRDYVLAQTEALAYLTWLKRFGQAYLENTENRDD